MTTREDLEAELLELLLVSDNSTLYPASRLTSLIKNSYMWATQLVIWHDLVRAVYTKTFADTDYYDYPQEFRSESIIRMEIAGDKYTRKNYEDFMDYKNRNSGTQKKMFASFGRLFFINPVNAGGLEMTLWGAVQADALTNATDEPIFSNNKQEGNEAVVRKAFSTAIKRVDPNLSKSEEGEAIAILLRLSKMEQDNTQRNKRLDHPMLNVPDFLGGFSGNTSNGSFNYTPEGEDD